MYRVTWSIDGAAPRGAKSGGASGSVLAESPEAAEQARQRIRSRARFGDTVTVRVVAL